MRNWTAEDDLELRRAINNGTNLDTVAAIFQCEPHDIRTRIRELGQDDHAMFPTNGAAS